MVNQVLWANNDSATLAASITNSQTTVTLTSGEGSLFPSPGAGQFFSVTLVSAANANNFEIVYCTSRSGDSLTVQRAREGTTGLAFNAGDIAAGYLTAGQMALLPQLGQTQTWTGGNTFSAPIVSNGGIYAANFDTGGASVRVLSANYGAILRSDNTNFYVLVTNNGSPFGSYNGLRPYAFNLSSGAVTIDGTGVGATFGGAVQAASIHSTSTLQVDSNATVNGSVTTASIHSTGNLQVDGIAVVNGSVQALGVHSTAALQVDAGATVNGNLGVGGTTTTAGFHNTGFCWLVGDGDPIVDAAPGWTINDGSSSAAGLASGYSATSEPLRLGTGQSTGPLITFYQGSSTVGSISYNGSQVLYNATSDYRVKDVFGPADGAWLRELPIHDAAFKTGQTARRPMGLAHEVAELAPWLVTGQKDAVDKTGKPILQQVDWTGAIPSIIAYAQAIERQLEELRAEIAALKATR